jgi:phosphate transport system substrate-binding protein
LPTALTVSTEDYLLSRRLYLYTASNPKDPLVRRFVDFALGKAGQNAVAANGFVAQNVKAQTVSVVDGAPADYKRLTDGAERLSLNFRFRTGSSVLDNKALPDLDRVSSFISDLKYSGSDIMLLGFADSTGSRDSNCRLAKDRAKVVSDQFGQRGLNPSIVNGFCSDLAVASNDTEEGREKNRRVEIWVKRR